MVLALALSACVKDDALLTPQELPKSPTIVTEDALKGEVIIKFKPEMETILEETMTRSGGVATRSGIPSTDLVLDIPARMQ